MKELNKISDASVREMKDSEVEKVAGGYTSGETPLYKVGWTLKYDWCPSAEARDITYNALILKVSDERHGWFCPEWKYDVQLSGGDPRYLDKDGATIITVWESDLHW